MQKHPFSHERGDMISTYTDTKSNISFYLILWKDTDMLKPDIINCIGSPALYQAVTAMRTGSDMWQYFTNGVQFILFDGNDFNEFYIKVNHYRKATLAEFQEHFK